MVTKVAEPSAYGVVVTKQGSTVIDRFVEKPVEFVGNRINAGIYMFNPSILDRIEVSSADSSKLTAAPPHLDREGDLPCHRCGPAAPRLRPAGLLDGRRPAQGLHLGFVAGLSRLRAALTTGTCLYLSHLTAQGSPDLADPAQNKWVYGGNVLVDPTAEIDPTALVGPNVVIGPGAKIGKGARLQRCVIMSNAEVRDHAWIASSIIGWNSTVGRWVSVEAQGRNRSRRRGSRTRGGRPLLLRGVREAYPLRWGSGRRRSASRRGWQPRSVRQQ
jgi:mannose-1-phosphate guanylyltransferase